MNFTKWSVICGFAVDIEDRGSPDDSTLCELLFFCGDSSKTSPVTALFDGVKLRILLYVSYYEIRQKLPQSVLTDRNMANNVGTRHKAHTKWEAKVLEPCKHLFETFWNHKTARSPGLGCYDVWGRYESGAQLPIWSSAGDIPLWCGIRGRMCESSSCSLQATVLWTRTWPFLPRWYRPNRL